MYAVVPCHFTSTQSITHSAVTELMSRSKKAKSPTIPAAGTAGIKEKATRTFKSMDPRNGLIVYIEKPESNPEGRVVEYDDDFVVINDKYPKARYAKKNLEGIVRYQD